MAALELSLLQINELAAYKETMPSGAYHWSSFRQHVFPARSKAEGHHTTNCSIRHQTRLNKKACTVREVATGSQLNACNT